MLRINSRISIPLREFHFTYSRSSGPGGQNVNKVNTRVQLRWDATRSASLPESARERFLKKYSRRVTNTGEIIITSQRFRDQGRNVADAINKLREMILSVATAPTVRKPKRISKGAKMRRLNDKKKQAEKKQRRKRIDDH